LRSPKKIGVSQASLNRWLNGVSVPNKKQWDRVIERDTAHMNGVKLSFDEKIAPHDVCTQAAIHEMVDNYLRLLPPPKR
jgi:hypothetical protein